VANKMAETCEEHDVMQWREGGRPSKSGVQSGCSQGKQWLEKWSLGTLGTEDSTTKAQL
jgi:hypothetical protein